MVEKPMTNTVSEARELLELAERKGLRLMPGHIERFNPAVSYLKNLIDTGKLGKAILLIARRVGRWPERIGDVGVVRDTAIHDIDLARYILKDDVNSVYARTGSMRHTKEDYGDNAPIQKRRHRLHRCKLANSKKDEKADSNRQ